jgi:hypothetical protein
VKADIDFLTKRFDLSPYQIYVLTRNGYKYNMNRIKKCGSAIYAPYQCGLARGFRDGIEKLLLGPRADLIGADRMIVSDQRGINLRKIAYEL